MRRLLAILLLLTAVEISIISFAQKDKGGNLKKITGIVTDKSKGSPLSGATVVVKGTNKGTSTSEDGTFMIEAKASEILEVTYVGYELQKINVGNDSTIAVSLTQSPGYLDEILFTGYTSQKNKEITGSVAVVKSKDLTAVPEGQVERMLQGRVAGLNVITSGEPGSAINIRLHGIGNFGDVTPLYIIDGVEGNINTLNPYDIESVQVLKDAGAYSIYGVRGANGVIVVSTRKGKMGKTKIIIIFILVPPGHWKKALIC
jgi:TonB-dependent SusC/RagA subfamily outer membrane receptor